MPLDRPVATSQIRIAPSVAIGGPRVEEKRRKSRRLRSRLPVARSRPSRLNAIRAAVAAMQSVFRRILAEGGIAGVEKEIASVADVFALQGDARMREIEKTFLR